MTGTEIKVRVWMMIEKEFAISFRDGHYGVWCQNLHNAYLDFQIAALDLEVAEQHDIVVVSKAIFLANKIFLAEAIASLAGIKC